MRASAPKTVWTASLVLAFAAIAPTPARSGNPAAPAGVTSARAVVEELIRHGGAEVAVAFRSLDGKDELLINVDAPFHAASTMKVPVMIELFAQARAGKLGLDDPLSVKNSFASIVDGSPYSLEVGDDSDALVYKHLGGTLSLRELCEAMITVSSNLATNLLIERLRVENVRRTVAALGGEGMEVRRGVEDGKAFLAGISNTTTARGLLVLMDKIAHGEVVDAESSRAMVEILKRQKFREAIPAGLPAGTVVAHKTGQITKIHHDAAIVYAKRPFVLVILVRGIEDEKASAGLMARITRAVYEASEP